jgi:polyhydroxyalkanoate synthesis regulator protein
MASKSSNRDGTRESKRGSDDGVITIKKYANRRLYDTRKSSYITLDDLAAMVREGREFIMEEEQRGQTMLPVSFLRQLISLYGDGMQAMVPGYLEASMDSFRRNQQQFRSALEGALAGNPLAEMAKRNLAMFEAAASAFVPGKSAKPTANSGKDEEIAALRAELEALKAQMSKGS